MMLMNLFTIKIYLNIRLINGGGMKRKILYVIIAILLSSCDISGTPDLLSIGFIDDRTIECEFPLFDSNIYSF